MNKRTGIVYFIVGALCFLLGYDIYLAHETQVVTARYYRSIIDQQQLIIDQEDSDRKFVVEHIEDIYKLSVLDSVRGYVTMDTLIRVFHYAKPHKGSVGGCPECADLRKRGLKNENRLPGERPKLPSTGKERTANVLQGSRRYVKSLGGLEESGGKVSP